MPERAAPRVAIIGSGPAGLALAVELGSRGIACVILERSPRAGHAPRAKTTNVRTREHLRRWGIAGDLAAASPFGVDYPSHILFVTSLAGKLIHRFENGLYCRPTRDERYSEHSQWIPQYKLEDVLIEHARDTCPAVDDRIRVWSSSRLRLRTAGPASSCARNRTTTLVRSGLIDRRLSGRLPMARAAPSAKRSAPGWRGTYGLSRNYNIDLPARRAWPKRTPMAPGIDVLAGQPRYARA